MQSIGHPFGVISVSHSDICASNSFDLHLPLAARFMIGHSVGIPAASLCINRRLYYIASLKFSTPINKSETRRVMAVDLAIGLGIPVLEMVLRMFICIILYS